MITIIKTFRNNNYQTVANTSKNTNNGDSFQIHNDSQNDITSDIASRQHTLSYVISNRDLKNKLIQWQNSKDIIDFLDKTELKTLELIKANRQVVITAQYQFIYHNLFLFSQQANNTSESNAVSNLKANFNKISSQ